MGSLGMPEILLILVIALIVFGPRKLPELGKSLGQSLAQFRRASEDFKRQWEDEVDLERHRIQSASEPTVEAPATPEAAASSTTEEISAPAEHAESAETSELPTVHRDETVAPEPKRDWV